MDKKQSHKKTMDKTGGLHPLQQAPGLASPQLWAATSGKRSGAIAAGPIRYPNIGAAH